MSDDKYACDCGRTFKDADEHRACAAEHEGALAWLVARADYCDVQATLFDSTGEYHEGTAYWANLNNRYQSAIDALSSSEARAVAAEKEIEQWREWGRERVDALERETARADKWHTAQNAAADECQALSAKVSRLTAELEKAKERLTPPARTENTALRTALTERDQELDRAADQIAALTTERNVALAELERERAQRKEAGALLQRACGRFNDILERTGNYTSKLGTLIEDIADHLSKASAPPSAQGGGE